MSYIKASSVCECILQVPCYVFDTDGKKHDLNPLIKARDGYLVDDGDDSIDFYINICRSLCESKGKSPPLLRI